MDFLSLSDKTLNKLITNALAIEAEEAKEAGALGFMARAMVQATLPHRKQAGNEFERTNGAFTMNIMAPSKIGLPYGTIPRLLLAWITTEAVKTKSRELVLGDSLSEFMRQLGLVPTGGRWGSITRLKDQSGRLFASSITCMIDTKERLSVKNLKVVDSANLWWQPADPAQKTLWQSTVSLDREFYQEIIDRPVPIDMRALKAIKQSPMALDIYVWATYRMSYLKRDTEIPWGALQMQFGADYPQTGQGQRDFKKKFLKHLKKVSTIYTDARLSEGNTGLILHPSRPHIGRGRK